MIRSKFMPLAALLMATEAAASTGAAQVPDSNTQAAAKTPRAPKNPDNKLDIINGRLPAPLVKLIRFNATGTNAERAKTFGTSVGKVFDIIKGRNFGYIDANWKPTADEAKAAKDWLHAELSVSKKKLSDVIGAEKVAEIEKQLDAMGIATAEEVAARPPTRQVGQSGGSAGQANVAQAPAQQAAGAAAPAAGGGKMF